MATISPDLIRALMAANGCRSVHKLAKQAGLNHSVLYEFLNGKRSLSAEARLKLAAVLPNGGKSLVPEIAAAS